MPYKDPPKEHQFKSGAEWRGNQLGRPKLNKPLTESFAKFVAEGRLPQISKSGKLTYIELPEGFTVADMIALSTIKGAIKGDAQARRDLLDRIEGKVKDVIEINGDDDPRYKASKTREMLEKLTGDVESDEGETPSSSDGLGGD